MKEPLPHLAIIFSALALILSFRRAGVSGRDALWFVLLPGLWFLAVFSLGVGSNLGIRYILFPIVCLFVIAGAIGHWAEHRKGGLKLLVSAVALSAISVLRIGPHFLSYFNEAVGGPEGGRHLLSDSNIDWGQDLKSLRGVMRDRGYQYVYLSYFGPVSPSAYGIPGEPLATRNGRSGLVAISVHQLNGIDPFNPASVALTAPYRSRRPIGRAGYSILLFEER